MIKPTKILAAASVLTMLILPTAHAYDWQTPLIWKWLIGIAAPALEDHDARIDVLESAPDTIHTHTYVVDANGLRVGDSEYNSSGWVRFDTSRGPYIVDLEISTGDGFIPFNTCYSQLEPDDDTDTSPFYRRACVANNMLYRYGRIFPPVPPIFVRDIPSYVPPFRLAIE
jgi:hypothetical protein